MTDKIFAGFTNDLYFSFQRCRSTLLYERNKCDEKNSGSENN